MGLVTVRGRGKKRVYGLEATLTELRKRRAKAGLDSLSMIAVGYSAPYAAAVHERLGVHHPNGQAKYLEQPIRTEESTMRDIVRKALMGRASLPEAQLRAANHLMSVSLRLVPRLTGALASSWFVRLIRSR